MMKPREGAASKVIREPGNLPDRQLHRTSVEEAPRPGVRLFTGFWTPLPFRRRGFSFMAPVIFITGGGRSGKSRLAERISGGFGAPLGYLATGTAGDGEMAERIARHRQRRGDDWTTIEEPLDLAGVLRENDGRFSAILVDCVTLWLTNLLLACDDPARCVARVKELTSLFPQLTTPLVLVSNEVGMGIVPENRLARQFRDLAGEANEMIAAAAGEVYVTFSGLPLRLK